MGENGLAGTGGGGGGNQYDGRPSQTSTRSGNGGSGIVIVRYQIGESASTNAKATGGLISSANGKTIHTFTSSGQLVANQQINNADYLVIAGGGAGGANRGGGGGAGGYRSSVTGQSSGGGNSAESKINLTNGQTYTITVGAGGAGGLPQNDPSGHGKDGIASQISGDGVNIQSIGGGAGRTDDENGVGGGSGGGSGGGAWGGSGGTGTTNQGYPGGAPSGPNNYGNSGSGGGGAGGTGAPSSGQWGAGGAGVASNITGVSITRSCWWWRWIR